MLISSGFTAVAAGFVGVVGVVVVAVLLF